MHLTLIIQILTGLTLAGLLFDAGLRVTLAELRQAFRGNRLGWVLPINFLVIPALTLLGVTWLALPIPLATGMVILAASPFAPVVPIFSRFARADLALSAGLTAVFPLICVVLTPVVCMVALPFLSGAEALDFHVGRILLVLFVSVTLPLIMGLVVRHYRPGWVCKIQKPILWFGETAGSISLIFVTISEGARILQTGWVALALMVALFEISLFLGYITCGPGTAARRAVALGSANRNIALGILVALGSFPDSEVVAGVVANGLLMILLGLVHTGIWRWGFPVEGNQRSSA